MKKISLDDEFVKLIQDNEKIIYKVCSVYVSDETPMADLYQDVVCNLWKSFTGFRRECTVSTWIYRVALNTCISDLRKYMKRPKHVSLSLLSAHLIETNELDDAIREMYCLIRRLSSLEKAIVLLYLDEYSYQEIADITGLTPTNVGVRLVRIKEKLKKMSGI
ncbi:MAG: sigma-70 family RNA polymerase sigma factor [Massilibacteroides sp.]|nr:sigma-70 family RNA polymerase sigma factor [Massilibacteroides sp.]MDD3062029.1 sigma-70 family RNA polymerase sigma factor [Massilibacteroides sp.]MDD4114842.1 sigma-70 family RNA polymerase sigma factor [Massilibacteroides sp.]MDD4659254.1 sigma-70 family RNA polymerase sigma factor [Massilibacteroides sp.]